MMLKGAEVFAFMMSAIPFAKNCTGFVAKTLLRLRAGDRKWLRRTIEAFMAKKRVQLCEDFENHQVIYSCKVYLCEMELITHVSLSSCVVIGSQLLVEKLCKLQIILSH